jgi:hypothetical protein
MRGWFRETWIKMLLHSRALERQGDQAAIPGKKIQIGHFANDSEGLDSHIDTICHLRNITREHEHYKFEVKFFDLDCYRNFLFSAIPL